MKYVPNSQITARGAARPRKARASATPRRKPARDYTIGSLRAGLAVLDRFAERETWSLEELTQAVGQAKSRVFRILRTFEDSGYIVHDPPGGAYRLGPRLHSLGAASLQYEQLRWKALPPLEELARTTGETAHIGILDGHEVVTVQLVEGHHAVRMHAHVGKRGPAHASALGKVLLAYFPEPEIDAFVRTAKLVAMTAHTVTDPLRLKRQLLQIRETGQAIDNQERELGLSCVAAPITDHTGQVVASVSISAPTTRLGPKEAQAQAPRVKECARTISRMLGSRTLGHGSR